MTRAQLEHLIRAASQIVDEQELMILGSQAVLGTWPNAPEELRVSMEADMYPRHRPELADLIDGSLWLNRWLRSISCRSERSP